MSGGPSQLSTTRALQITLAFMWLAGQWAMAQATGSIRGKVTDSSGSAVLGAVVTVEGADGSRHMTVTDGDGAFQISSLTLGSYTVKISANSLSDWTAANVPASVEPGSDPLVAILQVAPLVSTVTVGVGPDQVAAEQVKKELTQRVLGVIPNYYVTYENHPAPLSAKQKWHLGWRTLVDPTTFGIVGVTAAIQQKMNSYWQYGQGAEGFAKRYGAGYATAGSSILITDVLMSSVLRQDPRYFYSGQGTTAQRAWYAFKAAFRVKGDNGKWQPPYSDLVGLVASAEISQAYYPGSRTQYTLLGRSLMFRFAGRVAINLAEELLLKKVTTNSPVAANVPVLREGTPVPLIAVDRLSTEGVTTGKTVSFVLAQDLTVGGKVVAKTGEVASGQVSQVSPGNAPNEASNVGLERVTLRAGTVIVPLRSSQVRGGVGAMQYKELPGSGKIAVTLYVAESVQFPEDK
jgi:Carboxypeptidase regulatory-like domain